MYTYKYMLQVGLQRYLVLVFTGQRVEVMSFSQIPGRCWGSPVKEGRNFSCATWLAWLGLGFRALIQELVLTIPVKPSMGDLQVLWQSRIPPGLKVFQDTL